MLPKPFAEKGITLYLCDTNALSVRPWKGWVISHCCVHRSLTECESVRGVYVWSKISTITNPDSLNEDKTQMFVLFCVMSFCCEHRCVLLCVYHLKASHPPPHPCAHIPKVISSQVLTRLDRLPSAIWSVALVSGGYCNDSFCKKKKKKARLFAYKVRE